VKRNVTLPVTVLSLSLNKASSKYDKIVQNRLIELCAKILIYNNVMLKVPLSILAS